MAKKNEFAKNEVQTQSPVTDEALTNVVGGMHITTDPVEPGNDTPNNNDKPAPDIGIQLPTNASGQPICPYDNAVLTPVGKAWNPSMAWDQPGTDMYNEYRCPVCNKSFVRAPANPSRFLEYDN